jgi:hypothetical protein
MSKSRRGSKKGRRTKNVTSQAKSPPGSTPKGPVSGLKILGQWLTKTLVLVATLLALVPLLWTPSIASFPEMIDRNTPLALPVVITNDTMLPVFDLTYKCLLQEVVSDGFNAKFGSVPPLHQNQHRTLWWGESMTARCDTSVRVHGFTYEKAVFRLEYSYKPLVWPGRRKGFKDFEAIVENGTIVRWVPL